MNKYQNGDRVIMTKSVCYAKKNMIGTIRGFDMNYAIEFDKDFEGSHNCSGLVKSNRGQWVIEDCFEPYFDNDTIELEDIIPVWFAPIYDILTDNEHKYTVIKPRTKRVEKQDKKKPQDWNVSIIPDGDKTTLSLTVNGEQKEYTVKRYEKDTYSIEAAVKALVEKAFKLDLYLSLGESENYGKIGTPTGYHDKDGKPLFVGDVVAIYDPDSFEIAHEYVVYRNLKTFIMGIAWHCNDNTGKISYWTVEKIKDYSMAKIGDKIGNVEVISE